MKMKKVAEELVLPSDEQAVELKNSSVEFDKNKQTIMIIDDDPSMLWFVTEIFVGAYNVVSLGSAEEAFEAVGHPVTGFDYFGCNDARYGWNAVCQKIKSDKLLSRIPLILLSALNNIDEQTRELNPVRKHISRNLSMWNIWRKSLEGCYSVKRT